MRFACPKCSTRYNIPDEKLPNASALRFTCKSCGHVIRVKRKEAELSPAASPKATPSPFEDSTRVASLSELQKMREESAQEEARQSAVAAPAESSQKPEWFVLVNGKQRGPVNVADVHKMLIDGTVQAKNYAWKDGMAEWQRIQTIPDFNQAPPSSPAPPPTPFDGDQGSSPDATVAMNVSVLQEELKRMKAQAPKEAEDFAGTTQETAGHAKLPGHLEGLDPAHLEESTPAGIDESNIDAFAALTGTPAGGGLDRGEIGGSGDSPFGGPEESKDSKNAEPAPAQWNQNNNEPGYLNAAPGEATRVFMATAGIYRRRRNQKVWAAVIFSVLSVLTVAVVGDLTQLWTIPGMGLAYEISGREDPNIDRAIERTESRLEKSTLTDAEKQAIRDKLLGLKKKKKKKVAKIAPAGKGQVRPGSVGIEDSKTLSDKERDLAADIFGDERKKEIKVALPSADDLKTPNLPDGLTAAAILKVFEDNNRAMNLCVSEAMRKNESIRGRMEVQLTIEAKGNVSNVTVGPKFRNMVIGKCTQKRLKSWKFPKFNGESVTVSFPYVLSAGF